MTNLRNRYMLANIITWNIVYPATTHVISNVRVHSTKHINESLFERHCLVALHFIADHYFFK